MSRMEYQEVSGDAAALELPLQEQRSGFFYGWVMLPISMVGMIATAPGQTFGVSVFNDSFRDALGLTHTQLSGAYGLGTFLAALPMTYVGWLIDRYGPRRTMTGVVILFGAACLVASQAVGLVSLFLAFLMLRMFGQGALGLLSNNTLSRWFNRRLGLAHGLSHLGVAASIAVVPMLMLWLIAEFGWRWAYAIFGVGIWAVLLPLLAFLYRNHPEEIGQTPDGLPQIGSAGELGRNAGEPAFSLSEAFRTRAYWIVGAAVALWSMLVTAVMFHIVPIFSSCGLTGTDVATMYVVFACTMAVTHVMGGILADRLPLNALLSVSLFGLAAAVILLRSLNDAWMVYPFAMLLGASQGLLAASVAPLWVRYYGRAQLGRIQGSLVTVMVASSSAGPFLIGFARDLFGAYDQILLVLTVLPLPLAVLALWATPPVVSSQAHPRIEHQEHSR